MIPSTAIATDLEHILTDRLRGSVTDLTAAPQKSSHPIFYAEWESATGRLPIAIRFYQSYHADEEARIEAVALRDLFRLAYPVPELYLLVEDPNVAGAPFIVMERLAGRPLGELATDHQDKIPAWFEQASSLLLRLHSLKWQDAFGLFPAPMEALDFAERQVKWWMKAAQINHADEAIDGFRWLKLNMHKARDCRTRTLVHRDFHPDNVLALDDRITGVVDWGEITIADPAIDVAWSRMILETEVSKTLADQFNEFYWRRQPEVQHTQHFWEVFSACKRLTMMASVRQAASRTIPRESLPPLNEHAMQAVESFMRARLTEED